MPLKSLVEQSEPSVWDASLALWPVHLWAYILIHYQEPLSKNPILFWQRPSIRAEKQEDKEHMHFIPFIKTENIRPCWQGNETSWQISINKSCFCHFNYQINSSSDEWPGHQSLINVTLCGLQQCWAWLKNKLNDISIRVCFINNTSGL